MEGTQRLCGAHWVLPAAPRGLLIARPLHRPSLLLLVAVVVAVIVGAVRWRDVMDDAAAIVEIVL